MGFGGVAYLRHHRVGKRMCSGETCTSALPKGSDNESGGALASGSPPSAAAQATFAVPFSHLARDDRSCMNPPSPISCVEPPVPPAAFLTSFSSPLPSSFHSSSCHTPSSSSSLTNLFPPLERQPRKPMEIA
eukprot:EG_transcript_26375